MDHLLNSVLLVFVLVIITFGPLTLQNCVLAGTSLPVKRPLSHSLHMLY